MQSGTLGHFHINTNGTKTKYQQLLMSFEDFVLNFITHIIVSFNFVIMESS